MEINKNIPKIVKEYISAIDNYKDFLQQVVTILQESLLRRNQGIAIHSITSRIKSPFSFAKKIITKDKYASPLRDITDLVGVRIITYTPSDVDKIIPVIKNIFKIDTENSIDKKKSLEPDRFGYNSSHYVVNLKDNQVKDDESRFKDIKCEIQIKTICLCT